MDAARTDTPTWLIARSVFLRALRVAGVGVVLGVAFSLIFRGGLFNVIVYTTCITMACWFFVDLGRWLAARLLGRLEPGSRGWPGWGWMSVVIVLGSLAGVFGGSTVAEWMLGVTGPRLFSDFAQAVPSLTISALGGIAATYYFWSRSRIATTEANVQKAQRESSEAQLRLLQSQLEPHMLFNTLANLRVLIGADPARAQAMLDALIDFLRATLAASRTAMHPLEAEFARCADYLALMRMRMGPRLTTELAVPPELARLPVPALLLQPLVENAIKHGLEPKLEGGRITIGAAREGASLVLSVRDTGLGLRAVPAERGGFGLAQVRERLATLYGPRASLSLETAPDGSTLAVVRLPIADEAA